MCVPIRPPSVWTRRRVRLPPTRSAPPPVIQLQYADLDLLNIGEQDQLAQSMNMT